MDNLSYITKKLGVLCSSLQKNYYLQRYHIMIIKRFLTITMLVFVIQYLMISSLTFSSPPEPMYPPMGFAFMMFYLFGRNALLGLCLGGFCAYYLKDFTMTSLSMNLLADIGAGGLGAVLCQKQFSSDIKPFGNFKESAHFFMINAFITCFISSILRTIGVILNLPHPLPHQISTNFYNHISTQIPIKLLFFNFLDLWLADLNAILVFSALLLSWIWVLLSRTKITSILLKKIDILVLTLLIITSIFFINKYESIYIILLTTLLSFFWSALYGYLIATVLTFVTSSLYLAYFIAHKSQFVELFSFASYSLVPFYLLLVIVITLYIGHRPNHR